MRLYADLAPWFHAITPPEDYAEEAAHLVRIVDTAADGPAATLLELGAGGGNNALHLKHRFACTLSDLSPAMLAESRRINPECTHVEGDMRTLRLGRLFDVALIHDAIDYMTTPDDLRAAIMTAAVHLRAGGLAIVVPDAIAETFAPGCEHGGGDLEDGRSARYLEWTHAPRPGEATYAVDYAVIALRRGQPATFAHDRHVMGLFSRATWIDVFREAGLGVIEIDADDPHDGEHVVFVARRTSRKVPE